jgi:fused signal recognition particle receptor
VSFFKKIFAPIDRLKSGLAKTRKKLAEGLGGLFRMFDRIDEAALDQLEQAMIQADIGVEATGELLAGIRKAHREGRIQDGQALKDFLKGELKEMLRQPDEMGIQMADTPPTVVLVAGVNGSGKTTAIARLAYFFGQQGKRVLLAAGDTFRAAAIEQLELWSKRVGADIVKHQTGSDPGAVVFDAVEAAIARKTDVLIVDTAGRLHTKENLMRELGKIKRVIQRRIPDAPHEVMLVIDANTGQNAIAQVRLFNEAVGVTGIFLAKLDGTAKGGAVVAIRRQSSIPVKFVGLGETPEDVDLFDADRFVDALFD